MKSRPIKLQPNTIYIVTPSFNAEDTIDRTVLSVVTQAGKFQIRYHIQDGGSSDKTLRILERWKNELDGKKFPIHCNGVEFTFDSSTDNGMYDALIKGFGKLAMPSAAFMAWINADDILLPGALALVSTVGRQFSPQQIMWLGGGTSVLKDDMHIAQGDRPTPTHVIRVGMCDGKHWHFVQQEGIFFRRCLWDMADAASALRQYRLAGDWNLWRVFASHAEFTEVPCALGSFRLRQGQLSQTHRATYMAELDAAVPPEVREEALRAFGKTGAPARRILKARWPSGELHVVEKPATWTMFDRYKAVFGRRPECPWGDDKSEKIIYEANTAPEVPDTENLCFDSVENVAHSKNIEFDHYTYGKRSHWKLFDGIDKELFGRSIDPDKEQLKLYQDLFVLWFIRENIPSGSRILDVGGGQSRILAHLADSYECWNVDKLEGVGNGPRSIENPSSYKLVRDYIGNFNPELPVNYFDLVFSISALEHVPQQDTKVFDNIIADIDRILKPGGLSLHLFDVILKPNGFWTNRLTDYIFDKVETINKKATPQLMRQDPDFYAMSEEAYNRTWLHTTKREYQEHGLPSSLNILWRKKHVVDDKVEIQTKAVAPSASVAKPPRFFVVTPSLNAIKTIDKTIQSVISQSGRLEVHYHIQDGGSTDGTLDRIDYWADQIAKTATSRNVHLTWESAPDQGMYHALRSGFDSLDIRPDDFMTWINAGDMLMPEAFVNVSRVAGLKPEILWLGGTAYVMDGNDGSVMERDDPVPTEVILEGLCDGTHWHFLRQAGIFFRKSLWFKSKHALRDFRYAGDWNLWREFARHADYHHFDKPLGAYSNRAGQPMAARNSDYEVEISSVLTKARRQASFKKLYAARQSVQCHIVRFSDITLGKTSEKMSAHVCFESRMSRLENKTSE